MSAPIDRIVPFNIEAEEAVLGSLLLDANAIVRIASCLRPDDFYREKARWVFEVCTALHDRRRAIDFLTVRDELERRGLLEEVGGASYLTALLNSVPTSIHIEHYAEIVMEAGARRRMITFASNAAKQSYDENKPWRECVAQIEKDLLSLTRMPNKEEARHIQSILSDYMDVVEQVDTNPDANKVFVPTGLVGLDRLLGGLARGDMDIIAARPSLGKTSLLLKIASHIAADTGPVLLFSLEMSAEQLAQRLLSMETALPVNQLRMYRFGSNDMGILIGGVGRVSMGELYIDDTPGLTITEMRARARRLQFRLNQPLAMIGMDYIGLASYSDAPGRNPSEPEGLTHISKYAKQLAREMDCPFLVLSQLNREVEKQHEKRPMLSNLRMSGSLEQDADVAMFLYNYHYYYTPKEQREDVEKAEIIVLKHRNGDTGTVEVGWVRKRAQFIDWEW